MAVQPSVAQPQPVKAVIALRRVTQRQIAVALGVRAVHVNKVFNGFVPPTAEFAAAVAAFLAMPESKLFRAERVPVSPRRRRAK